MRIVAFGCSYTYGHALPDCDIGESHQPGPLPSKFAWPQLLADHYAVPCINEAKCGASNKEIWYRAVNFSYERNDLVLILWASIKRSCIFLNRKEIHQFGPWAIDDKRTRAFYKFMHTEYESEYDFLLRANHLKLYFDRLGIVNLQTTIESEMPIDESWNHVKFLDLNFLNILSRYPKAADGRHPGKEAHQKIADFFKHYIKL